MIEQKCRSEGVVFLVVVAIEKSVVATAVACVSVSVFGAGGRRSSCRVLCSAGRQAGRAQASSSKQQASESAPGNGSRESNPLVGGTIACACATRLRTCSCLLPYASLGYFLMSLSPSLPIFRSSCPLIHTSLAPNHPTHTARQAFAGLALRCAGSKAQARGSRLARPRSELCTRQTTTQTLSASCSAFRSPKGLDNDALLTAAVLPT